MRFVPQLLENRLGVSLAQYHTMSKSERNEVGDRNAAKARNVLEC